MSQKQLKKSYKERIIYKLTNSDLQIRTLLVQQNSKKTYLIAAGDSIGCIKFYLLSLITLKLFMLSRKKKLHNNPVLDLNLISNNLFCSSDTTGLVNVWEYKQKGIIRVWTNQITNFGINYISNFENVITFSGDGQSIHIYNIEDCGYLIENKKNRLNQVSSVHGLTWICKQLLISTCENKRLNIWKDLILHSVYTLNLSSPKFISVLSLNIETHVLAIVGKGLNLMTIKI